VKALCSSQTTTGSFIPMKRLTLFVASVFLALAFVVPTSTQAQTSVQLGPRLGLPLGDFSDATSLYFGADLRAHTDALPVVPNASFDYYLTDTDGFSVFAIDLNALYEFGVDNEAFTPYAGGGLAITRSSSDFTNPATGRTVSSSNSDVGLNIVGGARFPLESVEPFAQLNATLGGDGQRLGLTGGLLFNL